MNWLRVVKVAAGFSVWALLDAVTGTPNSAELALLAGFVVAWASERQDTIQHRHEANMGNASCHASGKCLTDEYENMQRN